MVQVPIEPVYLADSNSLVHRGPIDMGRQVGQFVDTWLAEYDGGRDGKWFGFATCLTR